MKYSVLIVADDEKTRKDIASMLTEADFTVIEVSSGAEALSRIKDGRVSVVISTVLLPDMNGIELIRETHRFSPDIEAILVSPYGSEATKDKLSRIGVFGYLEKPVRKSLLLDMVRTASAGRRAARILYGEPESKMGFNHERILIVDDDPSILDVLLCFLSEKGYHITLARDGRQAYEKILVNDFDCIITDVNMPEMDGVQTVSAIRAADPHTYILLISGEADSANVQKAMECGANRFMPKPLDYNKLISWIEEVDFMRISSMKRKLLEEEKVRVQSNIGFFKRLFNPYRSRRIRRTIPYAAAVIVTGILIWVISALFQVRMFRMLEDSHLFERFDRMIESVR